MLSVTVTDTRRARVVPAALAVLALLLCACGGVDVDAPSRDTIWGGPTASGVYVGAAAPEDVRAFGEWRGSQPTIAVDFLADETWEKIAQPTWWVDAWRGQGLEVAYSVPLLPDTGGTLEDGAAGDYDDHFTALAQTLVDGGQGDARLRLGWEFNGGWYAWSASETSGRPGASPEHFAAYWRSIVDAMRAVEGADFSFVWNPNRGYEQFPAEQAWPGADYVDEIGVDVYDQSWIRDHNDAEARFQEILEGDHGLLWFADFAEEHDKPLVVPEWGLTIREDGHGGGDNDVFVAGMHEFFAEHDVRWEAYFEFDAPDGLHSLQAGRFPLGAAQYRCRFGGSDTACPG